MSDAATNAAAAPAQPVLLGAGWLARFFALPPLQVFVITSLSALLLLVLPSWLVGVHWIPTPLGNVGIIGKPNWALYYTLILPAILAACAGVFRAAGAAIQDLSTPSLGVVGQRAETTQPYPVALNAKIAGLTTRLLLVCAGISAVIVLVDTWDLWYGYSTGTWAVSRKIEWDSACRFGNSPPLPGFAAPSCAANAAFALLAYGLEGAGIFLELFWLGVVAVFTYYFWSLLDGPNAEYYFRPIENDPLRRLGLAPMSGMYNRLLSIGVAFQLYAFLHRLQEIGVQRMQPWWKYPLGLLQDFSNNSNILQFYEHDYAFPELGRSTILPLIFMGVPLGIACWLPLWKLRNYVNRRKRAQYVEHVRAYDDALQSGDTAEAALRKNRMALLRQGQLWPYGDVAAYAYFFFSVALIVGTVAPPLVFYLLAGASVKVMTSIAGSLSGSRE